MIVVSMVGTWRGAALLLLWTSCLTHAQYSHMITELDKPVLTEDVVGVAGKQAALPCDTTPVTEPDLVVIVLWFKETDNEPLYSYDVRGRLSLHPKLWSSPSGFGVRAYFRSTATPAALLIDNVIPADTGVYRCRIDFMNSPTRNLRVNFTVITPPSRPVIKDIKTREPIPLRLTYNEGDTVELVCETSGGDPNPRLVWYLENDMIDDSFELLKDKLTSNSVKLPNVGRQHRGARLVCQATNTDLAPPETKVLILDLNLKPLWVQIAGRPGAMSADRSHELRCRSEGSWPNATITWWKAGRLVKTNVETSFESNASVSVFLFTPTQEDHGKALVCRAENSRVDNSAIEDTWTLNIHYVPVVSIKLGPNLDPDLIKEGDDVYFECRVDANPKVHRLAWYKGDQEIIHNASAGAIVSEQSLVLQRVSRTSAGEYSCLAQNDEGAASSPAVSLVVRYAPTCVGPLAEDVPSVPVGAPVQCLVDASPEPQRWTWSFHNGSQSSLLDESSFNSSGLMSTFQNSGQLEEFATLRCSATNVVGDIDAPCQFTLSSASLPEPVHNCSLNVTEVIVVQCLGGSGGGLPQIFLLEVLALPEYTVISNLTSSKPSFTIKGVNPLANYKLRVYSSSTRGRSQPVELHTGQVWRSPDKFTDSRSPASLPGWLAATLGLVALLLMAACGTLGALYRNLAISRMNKHQTSTSSNLFVDHSVDTSKGNTYTAAAVLEYCHLELKDQSDDTDPDVIHCHYDKNSATSVGAGTDRHLKSVSISVVNRGVTARSTDIITSRPRDFINASVRESCI